MGTERSARPQGAFRRRPAAGSNGYEPRDASAGWIFWAVALLVVLGVIAHAGLAGYLGSLEKKPGPSDAWRPVQKPGVPASAGVGPKLQIAPTFDLQTFRSREESKLNGYGWVDRKAGIARVPIDRAMELALKKGFPVRDGTNATGPSVLQLQQERPNQEGPKKGEGK
ncbi:MAG TPA: hypothetical protein VLT36_18545 [Candidatus Dormibacteraeota bacterium]|nr:hypothetical protein [Candidatus Dormibacteraeota bacterium]